MGKFYLGIIPARGGSKGVPRKNLRKVNGKSLLERAIKVAQESNKLSDFVVSTDDREIADEAERVGALVSSLRPEELATDKASTVSVVKYEIEKFEKENGITVDYAVLIQPTNPFRISSDIDDAISLIAQHKERASCLISCHKVSAGHPAIMYNKQGDMMFPLIQDGGHAKRRQDFDDVYLRNGLVYITSRSLIFEKSLMREENALSIVTPEVRSVNIDEELDLKFANCLASELEK